MTNANDTFWRQPKNAIIESIRPKNFFQCTYEADKWEAGTMLLTIAFTFIPIKVALLTS